MKTYWTGAALAIVSTLIGLFGAECILGVIGAPKVGQPACPSPPNSEARMRSVEFDFKFKTNSEGLREKHVPEVKDPNERRIAVVGDSFVEGYGVEGNQTFVYLLGSLVGSKCWNARFLNLGVSGTGPLHYARLLNSLWDRYQPDGVIVCLFANDLDNTPPNVGPESVYERPGLEVPSGFWAIPYSCWPRLLALLQQVVQNGARFWGKSRDFVGQAELVARDQGIGKDAITLWRDRLPQELVQAARNGLFNHTILTYGLIKPTYLVDSIDIDTPRAEAQYKAMMSIVGEIVASSVHRGVEVAIVYIPADFQYSASSHNVSNPYIRSGIIVRRHWLTETCEIQRRLRAWTKERGLPFLDLVDDFRRCSDKEGRLSYALDGHWNAAGHELAARAISRWINSGRVFSLLKCRLIR